MKPNYAISSVLLSFLQTIGATPLNTQQQQHKPNALWEFNIFQNKQCTGEMTTFSGNGSTVCRGAILNGGGLAYIPGGFAQPLCTVTLFQDDSCARNQTVGVFGDSDSEACRIPHTESSVGTEIRSYIVRC
ncbi:hypothetical protein P170DRAFT_478854 [Aspergillus steynii IBT 23096]|uniref:Uncharacterized protein n=1 Tax=Aspergillus steynii IBT 23096 TaxID=1392250 RepID=A0A2I2FZ56_9EURO|nr:uncharacterized protein P170DRAFT_478854 [Aspergillus steynii IBT 23096]PLB45922.1 hypothetical protein P170DRAFT_478854 [Aspergillus steynii IBT 23096]